ncbi:hypothetical protein [Sphingomonas colocasiae]|nr:hypothetical protein [Sphingomonas colocasiae]
MKTRKSGGGKKRPPWWFMPTIFAGMAGSAALVAAIVSATE